MSTTSDARCTPSTDEERRRKRPRFPSLQRPPTSLDDDDEGGTSSDSRSSVRLARSRLHDDTTDRRSSEADQPMTYMSVLWTAGKLGVAYYDESTSIMYLMLDAVETHDFQLLKKVCKEVQPTQIIVSSKQDERITEVLNEFTDVADGNNSDYIQLLPSVDFSPEICKRRLLMLNLPSIPAQLSDYERSLYMTSLVPFENVVMVRAAGALVKYLARQRVGIQLEERGADVPIIALQTFSLSELMIIDANTLRALQIFHREVHPSVYKAGCADSCKEGLSIYGILNRCKSDIGSKLLRLWLLRPLRSVKTLRERQTAVEFFVNVTNRDALNSLQTCLKNIKNVSVILMRMAQAQASMTDWQTLYKTVYNAIYIRDICQSQSANITIFKKICTLFTGDLQRIAGMISKIVDFEESAVQNRFVVKANVDVQLDKKRRTYNGLPDIMTKIAKDELEKLGDDIAECNIIYLPQLGYLLTIPMTDKMSETEDYNIEGLEYVFFSNKMVYYKTASTRALDCTLGDTQCDINDTETCIMHSLQDGILQQAQVLTQVMQCAAELDCLIALAVSASEGGYTKPHLTQSTAVKIIAGRHPLQELCCSPYVPNDYVSDEQHGHINILTGPNASGKSIYLKQVALIIFLAHVGSYVPARSADIPMIDRLFSRISTLESVSVGLSTFMIDLNQISLAVQCATEHSLVILDEFGKGTDPVAGQALLTACFNQWLAQKTACPHILASTHFHAITEVQFNPAHQIRFQSMDVLHDGAELVFLYHLVAHSPANTSYACHVASLASLPKQIVRRAAQVAECLKKNEIICRVDQVNGVKDHSLRTIVELFDHADLDTTDLSRLLHTVSSTAAVATDSAISSN